MNCALCQDYFFCSTWVIKGNRDFYTDPSKTNCSYKNESTYEHK